LSVAVAFGALIDSGDENKQQTTIGCSQIESSFVIFFLAAGLAVIVLKVAHSAEATEGRFTVRQCSSEIDELKCATSSHTESLLSVLFLTCVMENEDGKLLM
jgi:hypothetical protein